MNVGLLTCDTIGDVAASLEDSEGSDPWVLEGRAFGGECTSRDEEKDAVVDFVHGQTLDVGVLSEVRIASRLEHGLGGGVGSASAVDQAIEVVILRTEVELLELSEGVAGEHGVTAMDHVEGGLLQGGLSADVVREDSGLDLLGPVDTGVVEIADGGEDVLDCLVEALDEAVGLRVIGGGVELECAEEHE